MKTRIIQTAFGLAVVAGASILVFAQTDEHAKDAKHAPTETGHDDHNHAAAHGAHADEVKLSDAAIQQNNVRLGAAEMRKPTATFVAPARVSFDADAMAHVGSAVGGRVIEIKVRLGDTVKKHDELLTVESPEFGRAQSDFLQRRTDADIAAAATQPAKASYDRAKQLFDESQGIAFSEVQKRDAEYRAAIGQAASSKAALRAAENGLRLFGLDEARRKKLTDSGDIDPRFAVHAPIDGSVIRREVTLGELVSPEKEKLLVIADTRSVWVIADVPEARLADTGVGSKVDVQPAALPGVRIKGEVSWVSPEIDATTRTARLRIVVENGDGKLRPGMFAKAVIQCGTSGEAALAVPEEAVLTVEGKPSVFVPVEGEANTFARREVRVGPTIGGFVPVTSGLNAGEPVVVSGAFILKAELGKSEASHEH